MRYEIMMIISVSVSIYSMILLKLYLDIFLTGIKGKRMVVIWLLFLLCQIYLNINVSNHFYGMDLFWTLVTAEFAGILGYAAPFWKRLIFSMMFTALYDLAGLFALVAVGMLRGEEGTCMIDAVLLSKAVMLPLVMGIRTYMKKKELGKDTYGEDIFIILPLLAVIAAYYALYMTVMQAGAVSEGILGWLLLGTVALMILNLSLYPAYVRKKEEAWLKKNDRMYIKQIELYRTQKRLEEEEAAELKTLRHDLKQKLIYIHELVRHEEKEKLLDTLAIMIGETGKREGLEGRTGNLVVDALVNNLCMEAQLKGIRLNTKIKIPGELNIDDTDLCILQGNAFDNAVEALEYVNEENREMWLEMKYEKGSLLLNIKNRYVGDLEWEGDGRPKSRKKDGIHGIGLHSMKKVVNKYNGTLAAEGKNGIFTLMIILYEHF